MSAVLHIDIIESHAYTGTNVVPAGRYAEDSIIDTGVVVSPNIDSTVRLGSSIFYSFQDGIRIHNNLVIAVAVRYRYHTVNSTAVALPCSQHRADVEYIAFAANTNITGRKARAFIDNNLRIGIKILIIDAGTDTDAAFRIGIVFPELGFAGNRNVLNGINRF